MDILQTKTKGKDSSPPILDELDKKIIIALAENGRRPYREIARMFEVSEGTIRQRVNRMSDEGLIRIAAIGNLLALGFDVVAMIHFKVRADKIDAYAERMASYPSVRFVAVSIGNADIIIQSLHNNLNELHEFIRGDLPRELPEIVSTEIFPQVRTIKSAWSWDAWFELQDS